MGALALVPPAFVSYLSFRRSQQLLEANGQFGRQLGAPQYIDQSNFDHVAQVCAVFVAK